MVLKKVYVLVIFISILLVYVCLFILHCYKWDRIFYKQKRLMWLIFSGWKIVICSVQPFMPQLLWIPPSCGSSFFLIFFRACFSGHHSDNVKHQISILQITASLRYKSYTMQFIVMQQLSHQGYNIFVTPNSNTAPISSHSLFSPTLPPAALGKH